MQIVPRFCHVSEFQAPDCLNYNAVNVLPKLAVMQQVKSQPVHLKIQQITTSGENSTFFWRRQAHKYRSKFTKLRHFK